MRQLKQKEPVESDKVQLAKPRLRKRAIPGPNDKGTDAQFVSRHPGRDYSSFGSMKDLPDGVAYQKAIREEW